MGAGVIDADYRGHVKVVLFNHSETNFEIKVGDRIAQLVLEQISTPEVVEVESLEDTVRAGAGFGSTGVQGDATTHDKPLAEGAAGVKRPLDENNKVDA